MKITESNIKKQEVIENASGGVEKYINKLYDNLLSSININIIRYCFENCPDANPEFTDGLLHCVFEGAIKSAMRMDYQFANTIKTYFNRGTIVWAAPYQKVCFKDVDNSIYYTTGKIHSKPMYWIEEEYWDCVIKDCFKQNKKENFTKENIINNIRNFCKIKNYIVDEDKINEFKEKDEFVLYNLKSIL